MKVNISFWSWFDIPQVENEETEDKRENSQLCHLCMKSLNVRQGREKFKWEDIYMCLSLSPNDEQNRRCYRTSGFPVNVLWSVSGEPESAPSGP